MADLAETVAAQLADPGAGWSMGSWGAIAEFHRDPDEPLRQIGPRIAATARGAIRFESLEGVVPLAWETLSTRPDRWLQGVALCRPAEAARSAGRAALAELGPDRDAVEEADRGAMLFDLGLGLHQADFCIRTAEPDLITLLRAHLGRSILEPGTPAMPAILAAHPHRVVLTRLGRVEVRQKIGGPETGGVSPAGPHTHVLPKLLAQGRTHSANQPIPPGLVPPAMLHPAHPVVDPLGADRPFDRAAFDAFQRLLGAWGPREHVATKEAVWQALERGTPPGAFPRPETRLARRALRIALRQYRHLAGDSPLLAAWRAAFDPTRERDDGADPDMLGH